MKYIVAPGTDPVGMEPQKIVGDEVVHVDVLQDDRQVVVQNDMGIVTDLGCPLKHFEEVFGECDAFCFPHVPPEVDAVVGAVPGREVGDGDRTFGRAAEVESIVTCTAGDDVVASPDGNFIVPGAAVHDIVTVAAGAVVVPDQVVAVTPADRVVTRTAIEVIVARAAAEAIVPVIAREKIVAAPSGKRVIAGIASVGGHRFYSQLN